MHAVIGDEEKRAADAQLRGVVIARIHRDDVGQGNGAALAAVGLEWLRVPARAVGEEEHRAVDVGHSQRISTVWSWFDIPHELWRGTEQRATLQRLGDDS